MRDAPAILADWGTTHLRLSLCAVGENGEPEVLGRAVGPGVKYAHDFESVFLAHAAQLPAHANGTEVVIAGMIGSNIGWRETGYVPCPTDWSAYVAAGSRFTVGDYTVTILPGASWDNEFGYRDIMRGEEVQVLGALQDGGLADDRGLFCLPGTHTKWVLVEDGCPAAFATSMQGELFEMLCSHSVLLPRPDAAGGRAVAIAPAAFGDGLRLLRDAPQLGFAQALFAVRCRTVSGDLAANDAASYLSGLIIAADIRDIAQRMYRSFALDGDIVVVGDPALAALYTRSLEAFDLPVRVLDGERCTLRGLYACRKLLHGEALHGA